MEQLLENFGEVLQYVLQCVPLCSPVCSRNQTGGRFETVWKKGRKYARQKNIKKSSYYFASGRI